MIDLGCDPGQTWAQVGRRRVRAPRAGHSGLDRQLRSRRGSDGGVAPGRSLFLSVNGTQPRDGRRLGRRGRGDSRPAGSLDGLDDTVEFLAGAGVPFRIDPILEPIGFGFAASLGRYSRSVAGIPRPR